MEARSKRSLILRGAVVLCVVALLWVGAREAGQFLPAFLAWIETLGAWGPAVFILGYVAAVVAFVPGSVLTLAAGFIFGLQAGTAYVFVAAVIGSSLAFLLARSFLRQQVERWISSDPRYAALDRAVEKEGRKIVFLLRLSPLFPFNLLNYALGLSRVRFADYLLASLGMLPATFLYVYLGRLVGDLAEVSSGRAQLPGWVFWLGLGITLGVTLGVARIARTALDRVTRSEEESP